MSFSSDTRDELIRLPIDPQEKPCCVRAELSALTSTSASLTFQGGGRFTVTYRVENAALARRIFRLLKNGLGLAPTLEFVSHARLGGRMTCVLTVNAADAPVLLETLGMMTRGEDGALSLTRTTPHLRITRQCCRRAYLRGAFLGAGSVTNPDRAYHFEIIAGDDALCRSLERELEKAGLPARHETRRGKSVVYLKGAQQIADALALMGASNAVMTLENVRIKRQMRGNANRASNCDEHNSERMLSANMEQIEAIKLIFIQRGLYSLPPSLQEIARARLEHTELSLQDLGQTLNPPVGKSGASHRMQRLMQAAAEVRKELEEQKSRGQT